ncbi:MAG: HNH endonuclease, partial [Actinomycetia bacterium]|nr:HNH endonuclease [Actinomycetes bacterium]
MDATTQDDDSVVGDECHIVSDRPNGPRHNPEFLIDEIDSYPNIILLCRIHHKMVDDQSEKFTADFLRRLKAKHTRWVAETLELATFLKNLPVTKSIEAAFLKVKSSMPELIAEMKKDLTKEGNDLIRE